MTQIISLGTTLNFKVTMQMIQRYSSRSHNDDPDEPDDTGYPDTLDIITGTAQDPDPATFSNMGQEGTFTPHG